MKKIIQVKQIDFTYPTSKRQILRNCSFDLHEGELLSILGPNGAGKSTLLNCACDLLTPQNGEVLLEENNIRKLQRKDIARVIGYVQQTQMSTFSYTVFDYVLMGRAATIGTFCKPKKEDYAFVSDVLKSMNLEYLSDSLVTEISGGERQQAAIARAIAQNPKAIFFDEPTAHLDYGNQIKTLQLIGSLRDRGFAVIMTTHNPDHCMMLGGTVAIIDKAGNLETGPCNQIMTEERLKRVYNTELKLVYVDAIHREACVPCGLNSKGVLL